MTKRFVDTTRFGLPANENKAPGPGFTLKEYEASRGPEFESDDAREVRRLQKELNELREDYAEIEQAYFDIEKLYAAASEKVQRLERLRYVEDEFNYEDYLNGD